MPIYNREDTLVNVVAQQTESIEEIKQAQTIGYDGLKVKNYQTEAHDTMSVPALTYVEYTATFTFENPPSDALVTMSFDYNLTSTVNSYFITEYIPADYISNSYQRKRVLRVTAIGATLTAADVYSRANSTEKGSLSLVRTL